MKTSNPTVIAAPVNYSSSQHPEYSYAVSSSTNDKAPPNATPIHVENQPSAPPNNATPINVIHSAQPIGRVIDGFQETAQFGVCRRCRRVFERPPGVNDGQARYYRCSQCEGKRLDDIISGSCIIV